jgi:hypothetical protein
MRAILVLFAAAAFLTLPSAAVARDRDRDGLPDRWERKHELSTKRASANADPDHDRVDNGNEHREGTDPRDRDSDGDRRWDGQEDRDRDGLRNAGEDLTGLDPRDRDSDDDGVRDGDEQAGVVKSFENGVLVIALARGGHAAGLMTPDTWVECDSEHEAEASYARAGRGASGRASQEPEEPWDDEEDPDEPGEEDVDDYDDEEEEPEDDEEGEDAGGTDDSCPPNPLHPGTPVNDAELSLKDEGLVFDYVTLLR